MVVMVVMVKVAQVRMQMKDATSALCGDSCNHRKAKVRVLSVSSLLSVDRYIRSCTAHPRSSNETPERG